VFTQSTASWSPTRKAQVPPKSQPRTGATSLAVCLISSSTLSRTEIEASHKVKLSEWRTVDHETYIFSIDGRPRQLAEHMLAVGTSNVIIVSSESALQSRALRIQGQAQDVQAYDATYAWEVLEVYSSPTIVAFQWRCWGEMEGDYVGFYE
jgi:hypothetical protein